MGFEIDFLPVGESYGDAIVIRYDDEVHGDRLHIIDGGRIDTGETIIAHIEKYYPGHPVDHVVLSHADNDHACGLIEVLKRIKVSHLWMNRPWLYAEETLQHFHGNFSLAGLISDMKEGHPYLVELEELAIAQGTQIHEVFQGAQIGKFTVLAPSRSRYISLIPDFGKTPTSYSAEALDSTSGFLKKMVEAAKKFLDEKWDVETLSDNPTPPTSASNESCVVQYVTFAEGKTALLTADVGPVGLNEAADYAAAKGFSHPKFVQIPHHGSRHNVTPTVLDRWLGGRKEPSKIVGTAFCSVGANKPEYPRGQVKNAFIRRGYKVFVNRKNMISHYNGAGHPGLVPLTPEAFDDKVEA